MPAEVRPSAALLLRCAWCWLRGAVVSPQDIAAAYDRASPTYHRWEELMGRQLDGLLGPGELAGARVCDLACGTGAMSQRLLAAGAASVDAVDLSPGMLERCRARTGPGVTPVLSEAGAFLAAGGAPYDAITCTWAWPYLPGSMPRLLAGRLRPGGLLVVVCNRRGTLPGLTAAAYDAMAAAPSEVSSILTVGSRLPPYLCASGIDWRAEPRAAEVAPPPKGKAAPATAKREPVAKTAPEATAPAPVAQPGKEAWLVWVGRLRQQVAERLASKQRPGFHYSVMRQEVTIEALDGDTATLMTAGAGTITADLFGKLKPADGYALARDLCRNGDPAAHALAVFFGRCLGDPGAEQHQQRAGALGAEVDAAFQAGSGM